MASKQEAEEVLRDYAGLSSGDSQKLVSAVVKAAEAEALELIAGTDPVPSNMNDVRALRLRYISQALKQTLVQREVEVIFRLGSTQAANVISRMLATYAQDVDPLMKARLGSAATAEEAGHADDLRYLVHFDDAATFEYAHQYLQRSRLDHDVRRKANQTLDMPRLINGPDGQDHDPLDALGIARP